MIVAGYVVPGGTHDFESDPQPLDEAVVTPSLDGSSNPDQIPVVIQDVGSESTSDETAEVTTTEREDSVMHVFSRLQTLEREYSMMQGRIEELEYRLQEERHMNRRRFLDMDRRLREQFGAPLAPEDALTAEEENSETGLYRRGMAFIDAEDFEQATMRFKQLINDYPNGERVPDALYWLAEIYRNADPKELELARQQFVQMVTLYEDHARIPDALAKLGMIYHELGNETRALEYLHRVVAEFPDHAAAQLAETYARELR